MERKLWFRGQRRMRPFLISQFVAPGYCRCVICKNGLIGTSNLNEILGIKVVHDMIITDSILDKIEANRYERKLFHVPSLSAYCITTVCDNICNSSSIDKLPIPTCLKNVISEWRSANETRQTLIESTFWKRNAHVVFKYHRGMCTVLDRTHPAIAKRNWFERRLRRGDKHNTVVSIP